MSKTDQFWPKYTAEQISEIIDRITTDGVETQLASQQSRPVLEVISLVTSLPSKAGHARKLVRCFG
jgi:hypothetical protein